MADQAVTTPGCALAVGKCASCKVLFENSRFALYYDHTKNKRSCKHLVCGRCKATMSGWSRKECPHRDCKIRFYDVEEAVDPRTGSLEDFFAFVNLSGSGRITKQELADWYTTNFDILEDDVMEPINDKWDTWDKQKKRAWFGSLRSWDKGDLDKEEFGQVQEFMTKAFQVGGSSCGGGSSCDSGGARGHKRSDAESDEFSQGFQRNIRQRKVTQSEELQQKLRDSKGQAWFNEFDRDNNGTLERRELINAMLQTFMGSHDMTSDTVTGIVDSVWEVIDTDANGSVSVEEFQMLREAMVAEMDRVK